MMTVAMSDARWRALAKARDLGAVEPEHVGFIAHDPQNGVFMSDTLAPLAEAGLLEVFDHPHPIGAIRGGQVAYRLTDAGRAKLASR